MVHEFETTSGKWVADVASGVDESLFMGFKDDIRVCTWNSTALFCVDTTLARRRLSFVLDLSSRVDVLVIQEAHGQEGSESLLRERIRDTHAVHYFLGSSQAIGGIVFIARRKILALCGSPVFDVLEPGRIVVMRCVELEHKLVVIGVHIDPHHSLQCKELLLQRMSTYLCSIQDGLCFICGDFNYEVLGERSYNATQQQFFESSSSERLGQAWNNRFGKL